MNNSPNSHPLDRPIKRLSIVQSILLLLIIVALWSLSVLMLSPAHAAEPTGTGSLVFEWPDREWEITLPLVDLDKLCTAIAVAETSGCTAGVGLSRNNCHGLKASGQFRTFASPQESQAACIDLWTRKYGSFPTREMAKRYTGNDSPDRWLSVVTAVYNR